MRFRIAGVFLLERDFQDYFWKNASYEEGFNQFSISRVVHFKKKGGAL
jgi:hypothetical protein